MRIRSLTWSCAVLVGVAAPLATAAAAAAKSASRAGSRGASAAVAAPRPDVKSWQLDNGLQVLFLRDGRAPVVSVQVFYHVGSKNEPRDRRGIAHMFEHMMFKGSKSVRSEDHARFIDAVGGDVNGFTTEDVTAYTETLPKEHLGFALKLEAERMRNLLLSPTTVSSEREVVKEEKRMRIDASPTGRLLERFFALAFSKHPYAWTPAGFIEDLDRVTPTDCRAFYDTYYVPNNATLIVVGDVAEDEVRRLVQQELGSFARGPDVVPTIDAEPPQTALREETLALEANLPFVVGGYHIPEAASADMPALQVVATVLSDGQTSRLFQRLVYQEKVALFAGGFVRDMEQPGLFMIFAAHLPAVDQAKVRAALLDEIARVRRDGITPKELEKAKSQLTMRYLSQLEDVGGVATMLGYYQYVFGGWQKFLDSLDKYEKVTSADVLRVTQQYLGPQNLTLVSLVPGVKPASAQRTNGGAQ